VDRLEEIRNNLFKFHAFSMIREEIICFHDSWKFCTEFSLKHGKELGKLWIFPCFMEKITEKVWKIGF